MAALDELPTASRETQHQRPIPAPSRNAMDWDGVRVFLAIAREGSMRAAGRALGLSQPTIARRLTAFEAGFGAQPLFPPGINASVAGPFFNLYTQDVANPCTQGFQPGPPNVNKSGVVFFPGSVGLYRNGILVGGLGVSGDGVDQDDYVTAGGATGFEAPTPIRADQIQIDGVRLPYLKYPPVPTL